MDQNELNTLLRDADRIDRLPPIDTLVDEGIRRGRHRLRTRRLTAVGVLGTSLATLGAVVAFGLPAGGPGTTIAPAAVPTAKPSPSESSKSTSDKGSLPKFADLKRIIKSNLPDELIMRKAVPADERNNTMIIFELGDEDGYSWAGGGVSRTDWFGPIPCEAAQGCTESKVDGGVLRISRDTEKVGDGTWYSFERADGSEVWFGQRNAFDGNGPVTRERLPLTDKEVIKIITDPEWTKITDRLPKENPLGDPDPSAKEKKEAAKESDGKPTR
jgi:hypothetical protein